MSRVFLVETDLDKNQVDDSLLHAFVYGQFQGTVKCMYTDVDKLVFIFSSGEDASFFKLQDAANILKRFLKMDKETGSDKESLYSL